MASEAQRTRLLKKLERAINVTNDQYEAVAALCRAEGIGDYPPKKEWVREIKNVRARLLDIFQRVPAEASGNE